MIKIFRDLEVWKKGHKLVLDIYKLSGLFPEEEKFGLTSQIRRASVSVTSNIAEGFHRFFWKDRIRFYYLSRGSLSEVENLLIIAKDLTFLKEYDFIQTIQKVKEVQTILNGLIRKSREFSQ